MKKILFAAAMFMAGAVMANAEGYNRAGLSYDNEHFSFNKEAGKDASFGTNGFGLNYIHGFGVAENMFVEVGGNFNFLFGSDSETEDFGGGFSAKETIKNQFINLQVPVNYVYRFPIAEGVSIDPYVGLNFKLNIVGKSKGEGEVSGPGMDTVKESGDWVSYFDDADNAMGGKDYTWNRFQMGWHVGVGLNYDKYYLGVQYGTDFIPAYSHNFEGYKPKVNTADLKITVGYTF